MKYTLINVAETVGFTNILDVSWYSHFSLVMRVFLHLLFSRLVMSHSFDPMNCSIPSFSALHLRCRVFLSFILFRLYRLKLFYLTLEKEMATHSSILVWRIPGTEEPSGLPSMRSHRVGHDWSDLAAFYLATKCWISLRLSPGTFFSLYTL